MSDSMSFANRIGFEEVGLRDLEAVVAGGLFGSLLCGLVLALGSPDAIGMVGQTVGVESTLGSWFVLAGLGVLLGLPFVAVVSGSVSGFATRVMMLSRRSDVLRKVLVPALRFSAYGVTLMGVGTIYGVVVGVAGYGLALPLWLSTLGYAAPLPLVTPFTVLGWLVYGSTLGLVYGLIMEN